MRRLLMGAAECAGAPIYYYLLVETLENGTEDYGVAVEYQAQTAAVPALTLFRSRAEELVEAADVKAAGRRGFSLLFRR